ncbi:MAG TPA: DUF418 domain-containing protein, partial [Ferruginibacter sp.]|nr:DUF418 domain-containing protein [Ferruginibacter sp.]
LLSGKMRALIALVFGAVMVIYLTRENIAGRQQHAEVFIRRQLWLILFGVINAIVFLWTHDILFHLGIMGILLFPFVRLHYKALFIAAIVTTFIYSGKNFWQYADKQKMYSKYTKVIQLEEKHKKDSVANTGKGIVKAKDSLNSIQKRDKKMWESLLEGMKPDLKKDEGARKAMHKKEYGKIWNHLLPAAQSREAQWTYQLGIWDLASMIFLGMALFKTGFFSHRYSKNIYLLIGVAGFVAGLLLSWYRLHYQHVQLVDFTKYIIGNAFPPNIFFPFERAFMALGYTGLLLFILKTGFAHRLWKAFACVGKLSLTNYLLQSIICTIFFYGYGMGYYGRLSQFQLYVVATEIIIIQLIFSVLWLRYYNIGPAEWLLRRLSYGKGQPAISTKDTGTTPASTILL